MTFEHLVELDETLNTKQQSLNQYLETGCPNLEIVKLLGILFSTGDQYNLITTIMYLLNEIRHNVHIQCYGN